MPVSFIEAMPSTRLFELWLEQKLLDDHLSFRFGQLSADTEFIISKGAGAFLNAHVGLALDRRHQSAGWRPVLSAGGAGGARRLQSE